MLLTRLYKAISAFIVLFCDFSGFAQKGNEYQTGEPVLA